MATISVWFVQHAAADHVPPLMQRSWDTACAFQQWAAAGQAWIRELKLVEQVKSKVDNVLMSSIVDGWARAVIKSDRGPTKPSMRHATVDDEPELIGQGGKADSEFLGGMLVPRGARVRVGPQAWSSLGPFLRLKSLPGAKRHLTAIQSLLQVQCNGHHHTRLSPRAHSVPSASTSQESLPDTWTIFRHYAKTFIQPTHGIADLFSLKLNEVWRCPRMPIGMPTLRRERLLCAFACSHGVGLLWQWLILCEDAGLVGPTEPQKQEAVVSVFEDTQRRHRRGGSMTLLQYLEALVHVSVRGLRGASHPVLLTHSIACPRLVAVHILFRRENGRARMLEKVARPASAAACSRLCSGLQGCLLGRREGGSLIAMPQRSAAQRVGGEVLVPSRCESGHDRGRHAGSWAYL